MPNPTIGGIPLAVLRYPPTPAEVEEVISTWKADKRDLLLERLGLNQPPPPPPSIALGPAEISDLIGSWDQPRRDKFLQLVAAYLPKPPAQVAPSEPAPKPAAWSRKPLSPKELAKRVAALPDYRLTAFLWDLDALLPDKAGINERLAAIKAKIAPDADTAVIIEVMRLGADILTARGGK